MSASLVGSEMCIRDRRVFEPNSLHAHASEVTRGPGAAGGRAGAEEPPWKVWLEHKDVDMHAHRHVVLHAHAVGGP
eukprot:12084307-Alexandrium_andersonii.AAC.1